MNMSNTLNRRVEAASASLPAFDAPDTPDIIAALDAADAAVNVQAAVEYVKDQPIFDGWSDLQIARLLGGAVDAALGRWGTTKRHDGECDCASCELGRQSNE